MALQNTTTIVYCIFLIITCFNTLCDAEVGRITTCVPDCKNNGTCVATNTCQCLPNYRGKYCELEKKLCLGYPSLPKNSKRSCASDFCVMQCLAGYKFPDGTSVANMHCVAGQWRPSRIDVTTISDCQPECEPRCENGGVCRAPNICQCPEDYRGPQCQYDFDRMKMVHSGDLVISGCTKEKWETCYYNDGDELHVICMQNHKDKLQLRLYSCRNGTYSDEKLSEFNPENCVSYINGSGYVRLTKENDKDVLICEYSDNFKVIQKLKATLLLESDGNTPAPSFSKWLVPVLAIASVSAILLFLGMLTFGYFYYRNKKSVTPSQPPADQPNTTERIYYTICEDHTYCYIDPVEIRPCMVYCCHLWDDSVKYHLELLESIENRDRKLSIGHGETLEPTKNRIA